MKKYTEFPYPSKTLLFTVYGREGCPYCEKMKEFLKKFYGNDLKNNAIYHDIFDIIESKQAKDISDFRKKMKIFIGDYALVPMVFIQGKFIGGYDKFCNLMFQFVSENKANKLAKNLLVNDELKKYFNKKRISNQLNKCNALKTAMKK